jgi:hypothetical protein
MVEYLGMDDVMRELGIGEQELRRMVSEGELRAFRSENKMKFRKSDIENLRTGRMSEPTVILPAEPSATDQVGEGQEAALDVNIDSEIEGLTLEAEPGSGSEPAMDLEPVDLEAEPAAEEAETAETMELEPEPAAEAPSAEETMDLDVEDLQVAEEAAEPEAAEEAAETFVEEEAETGAETAPLVVGEEEAEAEEAGAEEEAAPPIRRRRTVAAAPAQAAAASVGIFTFLVLTLTLLVALAGGMVALGMSGVRNPVADQIAGWRGEAVWGNDEFKQATRGMLPGDPQRDPDTGRWVPYTTGALRPTYTLPPEVDLNAGATAGQ